MQEKEFYNSIVLHTNACQKDGFVACTPPPSFSFPFSGGGVCRRLVEEELVVSLACSFWTFAVESTIDIEDAVENGSLYLRFLSRLLSKGFRHDGTTIMRLSFLGGLERGR